MTIASTYTESPACPWILGVLVWSIATDQATSETHFNVAWIQWHCIKTHLTLTKKEQGVIRKLIVVCKFWIGFSSTKVDHNSQHLPWGVSQCVFDPWPEGITWSALLFCSFTWSLASAGSELQILKCVKESFGTMSLLDWLWLQWFQFHF